MVNFVYIATSLDGYIATPDGGIDWLMGIPNPDNSDFGFSDFMDKIDAILMGRNTFEKVLSFNEWPYEKPVFVLSYKLRKIPDHLKDKAEIVRGNIKNINKEMKKRGIENLYIDGGGVIQGFLREDLIDEMIITRVSVLLGDGIPLFKDINHFLKFKHIKTTVYNEDLVKSHYKRKK